MIFIEKIGLGLGDEGRLPGVIRRLIRKRVIGLPAALGAGHIGSVIRLEGRVSGLTLVLRLAPVLSAAHGTPPSLDKNIVDLAWENVKETRLDKSPGQRI